MKNILKISGLNHSSLGKVLFENLDLEVGYGSFVAIQDDQNQRGKALINLINKSDVIADNSIFFEDKCIRSIPNKIYFFDVAIIRENLEENVSKNFTMFENYQMFCKEKLKKERYDLIEILRLYYPKVIELIDEKLRNFSRLDLILLTILFNFISPPKLLLVEDCFGDLNEKETDQVMTFILKIAKVNHVTVLMTSQKDLSNYSKTSYKFKEGALI